jgi:uncharacterized protein YndB with AHSA1/START domain
MSDETIEIQVRIAARPATVYRFLSNADRFREWIGDAAIAPQPGGEIAVKYPNGDVARGTFVELTPNRRVVFTWGYDGSANGMPPGSSQVTIDLAEIESGTLLTLRHEGIPNEAARNGHLRGWKHYSTRLADAATRAQFGGRIQPLLDAYLRACNEPDEALRLNALKECWEPNATFCDPMGRGAGLEEMSRFIGVAHLMAPGFRLELVGLPRQTAEFVHFDWSIHVGAPLYSTGNSFGKLSLTGRFASMVAFWNLPKSA